MKKSLPFCIFITLVFTASFALADFQPEHWKYNKVIVPETVPTSKTFVRVGFDTEIYNEARVDFGDLRIIDSDGDEVEYGFIPEVGGERQYEARIIAREDDFGRNATVLLLDLQGVSIPTNKFQFMTTETDFSRDVMLEGSNDQKKWNVLLDRQPRAVTNGDSSTGSVLPLQYSIASYQYFRFTVFHGTEKTISFHGASALGPERKLVFGYDPALTYILHYGNAAARLPRYVDDNSFEGDDLSSFIPATLNDDVFNEAYVPLPPVEEEVSSSTSSIVGVIFPILVGVFVAWFTLFRKKKEESPIV